MRVRIVRSNIIHASLSFPSWFLIGGLSIFLAGCFPSAPRFRTPQQSHGAAPAPDDRALDVTEGFASYYGDEFDGRKTSSGEIFDRNKRTCAHRKYEFGTRLRVVNLDNGRSCEVVVNDRGPFVANRLVDLSYAAAHDIGMIGTGTARVRLEVLEWGKR